jgi:hypothetical protein
MNLGKFISDIKAKTIDPLLEEQAVAHLDGQLKRYQQETGNRLTDADFEEVNKSLTPDKIQSGYYAKEGIRDAIRSVPIAGKTIAAGIKSAAEIPALMLEVPEAVKSLSSFGGRKGVKQALGGADLAGGLAQAGKFTRDLASDVTGIQDGQGFQDLPTGIGTVAGALVGGAGYLKAIGAATEGALAANIFKDLTAKGIAGTAAQAGAKRFIAGTAANTVAGSPLSLAASMDEEGNINPKDLALNLAIDTAFGGVIEGAGAALTKNYGKQALREAGRMAQGQEGFIFRGNSKESLKGIAETNRAFNRRNVETYKAKGANEARAAEEAKAAAALKYEKIESDLMQARSLTEQRQGQLAEEQTRLGLKDETRQNVSTLNEMYEAEKQTAFKQVDAEQDKLVSEIQRESEQKTKDLVKQKADIDKQERTLTKPFDLEEKNLAKQQKQVNDSYQRAKKQAETEPVQMEAKPLADEEISALPEIKEANKGFGALQKDLSSQVKAKITNIKAAAKEKAVKLQEQLANAKKGYDDFLARQASTTSYKNEPARRAAEGRAAKAKAKFENYKKLHAEKIAQLKETVANQIDTVKTKQQQALEAKQTEINQLRADVETKRLQDTELQKQQLKEQRLKALDDEYNAARSDVDTRLSVTNANRNQAVSEFQAKKQALLEQQQKLEQKVKDKIDYLNRRREVLKKQKEVALNRQFKKDALREYRAKMGAETPVLRNADDIEVDRMIAKEELNQIDSQLAELRNKMNPPDTNVSKQGANIPAATAETFYADMMQAMYPNNKKLKAKTARHGAFVNDVDIPTATTKPENIVVKKIGEAGDLANDVLQPMISGLRDVSARLAGKVRQFEFMAAKKANKYLEPAATFFTKLNRFLTKEEKELFNSYLVKGDQESILAFLSKIDAQGKQYQELPALIKAPVKFLNAEDTSRDFLKHINKPLTEQWQAVRETLDDLHGQLEDAGIEVGYIQDYFPTSVKKDSVDTWREIFGIGTEERSAFDAALKQERKRLGRDLDLDEENEFINKYLRGYGNTNSTPVLANLKARSGLAQGMEGLTFRDAKGEERLISTLYNDPSTTLENYINRATFDIESRKFFGRTEEGLDTSIGAYVNDLMVSGQIKGSDVDKVKELLTARFVQGPKKPADFTRLGKDLAIGFALNDIGSALVQVNEVGMSFYRNGLLNTIKGLGQSFDSKALKTLDLGIQRIGADYADAPSIMRAAVDLGLKLNGFKAANKLMQETQINAGFNYFKNVFAKEKGARFNKEYSYLKGAFGAEEADRMVDAFRSKSLQEAFDDDSIGLALFDRLGATQVISLSDMPKVYLKHPNSRMFYALKSFALKQLQFIKDESYSKIAGSMKSMATEGANPKNIKLGGEGLRNLMALGLIVGGTNTGVNYLRDALRGKTSEDYQSLEERAVEGLMQATVPIVNPFIFYKIQKEGIGNALKNWVSPATPLIDNISKDTLEFGKAIDKGEDYNPWLSRTLFSMIPVAGATLWSWSPAGREQYEKVIKAKVKNRATKEKKVKEKELAELRGY